MSFNLQKWINHSQKMAKSKVPLEQVYVISQKGCGLGSNRNGKVMYGVNDQLGSGTINISPVQQGIQQAKSELKNEYGMSSTGVNRKYIKRKKKGKSTSKTTGHRRRKNPTFLKKRKTIGVKHKSRKRDILE